MADVKTVLVCFGPRNREVTFQPVAPGCDVDALEGSIRKSFADVESLKSSSKLILQVKDENWAGMFVDLRSNSRIEDRTVIRVEVEPEPMAIDVNSPQKTSAESVQMELNLSAAGLQLQRPSSQGQTSRSHENHSSIIEEAKIYRKESARPLSKYQIRINEEAGKLALEDPSMLTKRGQLLEKAREQVMVSGYAFKKGRSRSKKAMSSDTEEVPKAQKPRYDSELRQRRFGELKDEVEDLKKQLLFKEKRRTQAETNRNYKLCDEVTAEIIEVKQQKREKEAELAAIDRKIKKAAWHQKRKRSKSIPLSCSTPSGATSDESEVLLPTPSSVTCSDVLNPTPIELFSSSHSESDVITLSENEPQLSSICTSEKSFRVASHTRNMSKETSLSSLPSSSQVSSCEREESPLFLPCPSQRFPHYSEEESALFREPVLSPYSLSRQSSEEPPLLSPHSSRRLSRSFSTEPPLVLPRSSQLPSKTSTEEQLSPPSLESSSRRHSQSFSTEPLLLSSRSSQPITKTSPEDPPHSFKSPFRRISEGPPPLISQPVSYRSTKGVISPGLPQPCFREEPQLLNIPRSAQPLSHCSDGTENQSGEQIFP